MTAGTTIPSILALHQPSGRLLARQETGSAAPAGSPQARAQTKAEASSQDFEAVFLQEMVGEMMQGLGSDGPLGEGAAGGAWRSMLVQEYAGAMARSGGIGIAAGVYRDILALQGATPATPPATPH